LQWKVKPCYVVSNVISLVGLFYEFLKAVIPHTCCLIKYSSWQVESINDIPEVVTNFLGVEEITAAEKANLENDPRNYIQMQKIFEKFVLDLLGEF